MTDFYQELNRGASPTTALLAVRRRWAGSAGHPALWAPFILVGQPPVQLSVTPVSER